jgi:hypothetical protein
MMIMRILDTDPPALAIGAVAAGLVSASEADANGEPANVADGLFAIARALDRLAGAVARVSYGGVDGPAGLELLSLAVHRDGAGGRRSLSEVVGDGLGEIANAIVDATAARE